MNEIISENFKKLFERVLRLRTDLETERRERLASELKITELMEKIAGNGKDLSESMLKMAENEVEKLEKKESFLSKII